MVCLAPDLPSLLTKWDGFTRSWLRIDLLNKLSATRSKFYFDIGLFKITQTRTAHRLN